MRLQTLPIKLTNKKKLLLLLLEKATNYNLHVDKLQNVKLHNTIALYSLYQYGQSTLFLSIIATYLHF